MTVLWAAPPAWWSDSQTQILDTANPTQDNYAPANLGQLKHVAKQAKAHLDATLPGGAGNAIDILVTGFGGNLTTEQRDANYAPINLGQLKSVAKPFYDRLLSVGYDTRANLIAHGYPATWGFDYPWNPATPVEENYAPANLGQLKIAFSFDASTLVPPVDTDGDGISDAWELEYFGNLSTDPNADPDGDGVSNLQEYINGTNPLLARDSDNDGLPDDWEIQNGLDPANDDSMGDADQDGVNNITEFRQGRNPNVGAISDTTEVLGLKIYTQLDN